MMVIVVSGVTKGLKFGETVTPKRCEVIGRAEWIIEKRRKINYYDK